MRIVLLSWWRVLGVTAILIGLAWCIGAGVVSFAQLVLYLALALFGAWTTPKTWTAVVVTVADLNTHIRDNLNYLKAGVDTNVIQVTTSTGTQNDFVLTTSVRVLYCNNATLLTLTGFLAGVDGQRVLIVSKGAGQVDLAHATSAAGLGSSAANRVLNIATSGATSLAAGSGMAEIEYDLTATRWRLIHHEQGAWITPTFAAGDYTGSGSLTWTVDSGDVVSCAYNLSGRELVVRLYLSTTSTGGTASNLLRRAIPGGYTAVGHATQSQRYSDAGGTSATGFGGIIIATSSTLLLFAKVDGSNWSNAATNTTSIEGVFTFEVL